MHLVDNQRSSHRVFEIAVLRFSELRSTRYRFVSLGKTQTTFDGLCVSVGNVRSRCRRCPRYIEHRRYEFLDLLIGERGRASHLVQRLGVVHREFRRVGSDTDSSDCCVFRNARTESTQSARSGIASSLDFFHTGDNFALFRLEVANRRENLNYYGR